MKKHILYLTSFGLMLTASAQIPNNDFEKWTKISATSPNGWNFTLGKITKSTDAHSGTYAIKLETDTSNRDVNPGVVLNGYSNDGKTFTGGFPLAAKPDSLIVWLKYNIAANDTALIFVFTKKAGLTLSSNTIKLTQFANGYMRKAFKLNYTVSGQTPDSAILGFTCTNVLADDLEATGSYIIIDDISFSGTSLNVPNPGFENWTEKTHYLLDDWSNNNYDLSELQTNRMPRVVRTADKATGTYALMIQNTIENGDTSGGYVTTLKDTDGNSSWRGDFPVSGRKDTLYGLYKWLPENNDSFKLFINFWKNGNQVGYGNWINGGTQSSYKIFKIPVTYNDLMVIPDSAKIEMYSSLDETRGRSKLYIDNLNFNAVYGVGVDKITKKEVLILYPNPASDALNIILPETGVSFHAVITDAKGAVVKTLVFSGEKSRVDIKDFTPGIYLLKLEENGVSVPFIKK